MYLIDYYEIRIGTGNEITWCLNLLPVLTICNYSFVSNKKFSSMQRNKEKFYKRKQHNTILFENYIEAEYRAGSSDGRVQMKDCVLHVELNITHKSLRPPFGDDPV